MEYRNPSIVIINMYFMFLSNLNILEYSYKIHIFLVLVCLSNTQTSLLASSIGRFCKVRQEICQELL